MELKPAAAPSHIALTTAPGSGFRCDACDLLIEAQQVECRCVDRSRSSASPLRFHQWCYYALSRRVAETSSLP